MLSRLFDAAPFSYVGKDVDRLERRHGSRALFRARQAVIASRESSRTEHWSRVLHIIEQRSRYRPW